MIRWWFAMIIGGITLSIGYWFGKQRSKGYLKQAMVLTDRLVEMLEQMQDLMDEYEQQD